MDIIDIEKYCTVFILNNVNSILKLYIEKEKVNFDYIIYYLRVRSLTALIELQLGY